MRSNVLPGGAGMATLRPKNQVTIPDAAVKLLGAEVGDRFVVTVQPGGGPIVLTPVRETYAGTMAAVYPPNAVEEIRRDRDAWNK